MPRIVDLTMTLRDGMRGVAFEPARRIEEDGWNAQTLRLYSHAGTHMDAPRHFDDAGATIDRVALEKCVGPARIVDLTPVEPREIITLDRLGRSAESIGEGDRVLLRTGWSDDPDRADYRARFPRVGIELARWFAERRIALLGVDAPSVADVNDREELTAVHRALLDGGIAIVEDLVNLGALRKNVVMLVALSLKVLDGDGAPARVIAIEGHPRVGGSSS